MKGSLLAPSMAVCLGLACAPSYGPADASVTEPPAPDGGAAGAPGTGGAGGRDAGVGTGSLGRWAPAVQLARVFARGGYDFTSPQWLRVAADGSIYMAGPLSGEMAFYRTSLADVSVVSAGHAAFVVKLAPDGTLRWARGYASATYEEVYDWRPPALMPDGSILLCGAHGPAHSDAAYVERLGPDGQTVWLTELLQGGPSPQAVAATPDGDAIAVGAYGINQDLDPGPALVEAPAAGQFVMKLSSASGAIEWLVPTSEAGWMRPTVVTVPADAHPLVGGGDPVVGYTPFSTLVRLDASGARSAAGSWLRSLTAGAIFVEIAPLEPARIVALTQDASALNL